MRIYTTDGYKVTEGFNLDRVSSIRVGNLEVSVDLMSQWATYDPQSVNPQGPHYIANASDGRELGIVPPQYQGNPPTLVGQPARLLRVSLESDTSNRLVPERDEDHDDSILVYGRQLSDFDGSVRVTGVDFTTIPCPIRQNDGHWGGRQWLEQGDNYQVGQCRVCGVVISQLANSRHACSDDSAIRKHPNDGEVILWEAAGSQIGATPIILAKEYSRGYVAFDQSLFKLEANSAIRIRYDGQSLHVPWEHFPKYVPTRWHEDRYLFWTGQKLLSGTRSEVFPDEDLGGKLTKLESLKDCPYTTDSWSQGRQTFTGERALTDALGRHAVAETEPVIA